MFGDLGFLILSLVFLLSFTLLIEFILAANYLIALRPYRGFQKLISFVVLVAMGLTAILGLFLVGRYAIQGINDKVVFLGFCLLFEVFFAIWLIRWYKKIINSDNEADLNQRITFTVSILIIDGFLLFVHIL